MVFLGSVRAIICGDPQGFTSADNVFKTHALGHVHECIQTFPEGFSKLVEDRGIKLSGGQRQRGA
jgi:ABC-type bacteriocin/lantibiotic exporter with double-glycine peptidase domain